MSIIELLLCAGGVELLVVVVTVAAYLLREATQNSKLTGPDRTGTERS